MSVRRWLVLVGHVCTPVRDFEDDDAPVVLFDTRQAAEQWIADNPKAKFPQVVAARSVPSEAARRVAEHTGREELL